jgi:hypothetical protein
MNRFVLALFLVPLAAAADTFQDGKVVVREDDAPAPIAPVVRDDRVPDFSRGAVIFGIQGGYAVWGLNLNAIKQSTDGFDPGGAEDFVAQTAQGIGAASLKLGYNILGHVTIDAELTANGWRIFDASRGGAGFLIGALHWHPLQIARRNQAHPLPFDASLFFGYGYGIGGSSTTNPLRAGTSNGMDGQLMEFGVDATYFVSKTVGFGIFGRGIFLNWDKYYIDFDNKVYTKVAGPVGSVWTFGVAIEFRGET